MLARELIDANDEYYDPAAYQLHEDPAAALTLDEVRGLFASTLPDPLRLARGVVWTGEELERQPWIAEYINDGDDGRVFCDLLMRRYGEVIPAAQARLDYAADVFDDMTVPLITANSGPACVTKAQVCAFTDRSDVRDALHALYRAGLVDPLIDSPELLAPRLVLRPVSAR